MSQHHHDPQRTDREPGGTDGEIFTVIRDGVGPEYVMGPWKDRLPEQELWHVVNYIKSLAAKR